MWKNQPRALNHKKDILFWMTYWPFSAPIWFASEFLREVFMSMFYRLLGGFDRVLQRHTRGLQPPAE
jgi:hypothetical protein